jgi:hypothetical protein
MKNPYLSVLFVVLLCAMGTGIVSAQVIGGDVTPPETTITVEPTLLPTLTEPTITITIPTVVQPGGGKGWIDTYCNVDGAIVYFDGVPKGNIAGGILSVGVSPSGTPVRQVTVSRAGYTTSVSQLPHMPADQEHVPVYATINPIATPTTIPPVQSGAIYAQSSPAGAAIYVNGNFYGYSPLTIPNLAPGTFSVKASLSGYTPDVRSINVYNGQTSPYYPTLQPSPPSPRQTGTVSVTSNPDHALVYVDDNYQGKAPLTVTQFPGSHTFRLSLSGYNDYSATIYVSGGQSQVLNAIMSPAVLGTVSVSSLPGANVFIDSNLQGTIPSSGVLTMNNVQNGNRVFKVTRPSYNDWINTVYVVPNTLTAISATLVPAGVNPTPVPATGGFNIVSTPTGAEVYVDNLFRGYTPANLDGISAGQHTILLKYTGYVDYSTTASVNPGQVTPLAIGMQPAPTPTPASAPSLLILIGGLAAFVAIGAVLRRRS